MLLNQGLVISETGFMGRGFIKRAVITIFLAALVAVGLAQRGVEAKGEYNCKRTESFSSFLRKFKQHAAQNGISRRTLSATLDGLRYDPKVLSRDRRQGVFSFSFLKFSSRMISSHRLAKGRRELARRKRMFRRIEQKYGVPGPVLVAFWGLETDFGAFMGKSDSIRSIATLAWDCRRPELFRKNLLAALKIVENGDLRHSEMRGPWAGELGHTQFLPEHYLEYGVDFDGDGHRNLIRSVPDAMASTANYLKHIGWKSGQPWIEEVRVPASMPWEQADKTIKHSLAQWSKWGVRSASGRPLRDNGLKASLILPMGRNGPAFLGYDNFFKVYQEWNHSAVYSTTAAYFATRLAGKRKVSPGRKKVVPLTGAQTKQLQRLLRARGFDVGKIDGIIGAGTRTAVKAMQKKYGMPADSYPTLALLRRLR